MRKFNLKGNVARKLSGLEQEDVRSNAPAAQEHAAVNTAAPAEEEKKELLAAWRTDVGKLRKSNQDAVILGSGLFGVADGMGGHNGGEIASAGLRDGLLRELEGCKPDIGRLEEAVKKVNLDLWNQQEMDASLTGMGTTMTVIWPAADEMLIAHVGDSRCYLIRGGKTEQVTMDHSMVADMVRKGVLTEEQAACHPMRNYITRAVGTEDNIAVDLVRLPRKQGDRWLICSDGLHGQISKEELSRLAMTENLEEAASQLLFAALENGGKDNISLVLLQDRKETVSGNAEPEQKGTAEPKAPDGGVEQQ